VIYSKLVGTVEFASLCFLEEWKIDCRHQPVEPHYNHELIHTPMKGAIQGKINTMFIISSSNLEYGQSLA
jgi:hypothetical protein